MAVAADTARTVAALRHDWRNRGLLELRPVEALMARLDVNSVRDLRDYGDDTDVGIVASMERDEPLFGTDMGLERERQMQTALVFTAITAWLRPSLSCHHVRHVPRPQHADALAHRRRQRRAQPPAAALQLAAVRCRRVRGSRWRDRSLCR